jgi:hypothetical protein
MGGLLASLACASEIKKRRSIVSRWKFDPDSPLASGLLELEDSQWRVVEKAVERSIWKKIEASRDRAIHVLAIDPALVTISDEARKRAGARFGINLEVVPFLQT